MESLLAVGIMIGLICWAYKSGKHEGSVKGYGVGRRHERRFWRYRKRRR